MQQSGIEENKSLKNKINSLESDKKQVENKIEVLKKDLSQKETKLEEVINYFTTNLNLFLIYKRIKVFYKDVLQKTLTKVECYKIAYFIQFKLVKLNFKPFFYMLSLYIEKFVYLITVLFMLYLI